MRGIIGGGGREWVDVVVAKIVEYSWPFRPSTWFKTYQCVEKNSEEYFCKLVNSIKNFADFHSIHKNL